VTLRYDKDRDIILVSDGGGPELRDDILALVKQVIAAEREACATIADETSAWCRSLGGEETAESIAAAIRARGEQT